MALGESQRSLRAWTKQKWRTKSGKPSTQGPEATGERYLPEKAIKALSSEEYARTTAKNARRVAQESSLPNSLNPLRKRQRHIEHDISSYLERRRASHS